MALNILVVDDSEAVRSILAKTLAISDVDVGELHGAANGKEAIDILEDHWIDLIFFDIDKPMMGGAEMNRQMRQNDVLKKIPVIVVSTKGSLPRIEQLKARRGVRTYVRAMAEQTVRHMIEGLETLEEMTQLRL